MLPLFGKVAGLSTLQTSDPSLSREREGVATNSETSSVPNVDKRSVTLLGLDETKMWSIHSTGMI